MADCCNEIKAELAALKAEIAKLSNNKIDKNAIIQAAISGAVSQLMPDILGAKSTASSALGLAGDAKGLASDGISKSREALERAYNAKSAADAATRTAGDAAGKAGNALGKATQALAAIAALAVSIAAFAAAIATLNVLGGRIDAVESGLSQLGNDVSRVLGSLLGIKSTANNALSTANNALNRTMTPGPKGEPGERGLQGVPGIQGKPGERGLQGIPGERGLQGIPGAAGKQGERGLQGIPGERGLQGIPGAAGKQGERGLQGISGERGLQGIPGAPGKQGERGLQGIPGAPGKQGERGLQGIPGAPGKQGERGLPGLNGKNGVDATMDAETKAQIQKIAQNAAFIPALIARPVPLNQSQTITAAASGTCRTTQPGGCSRKMIDDAVNKINSNSNNKINDLLNKLNAGANAAQLALLNTINTKLGGQIVGGISGSLVRFYQWTHLDRALNLLTFAATVHNGMMLSSEIGQTLTSALANVLSLIGIKDKDGSALNLTEIIGNTIENTIKGVIGAENYTELSQGFAKANRIYQASINVLNSFQNLTSTVLNALEVTVGRIGKIGNALRKSGEVLESAYGWMNPQPKFNRITQGLEALQNGASTIQMVTQAPLDVINAITEQTNASTAFVNAIKDDGTANNIAVPEPEPDILKAAEAAIREASAGKDMTEADLEADE